MKKSTKLLSMLLALSLLVCTVVTAAVTVSAAGADISYSFKSNNPGFAEGTITLTGEDGTYYLYWADGTKALDGYRAIGTVTVSSSKGTLTMPAQTAIPADAQKLIAFKASSEPAEADRTAAKASAVYSIPSSHQLSFGSADALYTFGSISDTQLANDSYGSGRYPNDEIHLIEAFKTLADRDVDFVVSSGDVVNDQNGNQTYSAEYKRYQKILADSPYANPIYEANGNHDVCVSWSAGTFADNDPFSIATGLDSKSDSVLSDKAYFEFTEPTTGDHFIFMALEGRFHTNQSVQFTTEQLDWLEGLLKKYSTDGKNIFIIEHAAIKGWGSGDRTTAPYFYDLSLDQSYADVQRFIKLMETYKECVIITGHTHLNLEAQYNYSDNNGTSAVMMHNSAIGGVRRLVNPTDSKPSTAAELGLSEGYIVEVFEDCIIFNGTNMYYNEIMPQCTYIIPFDTEAIGTLPTEPEPTTEGTTAATVPTEASTAETKPAETTTATAEPTEKTEPSEATDDNPTEPEHYLYGDADLNGTVNIKDATAIQKHSAGIITLEGKAWIQANVSGDAAVNVRDVTAVQKWVADIISFFPVEKNNIEAVPVGAAGFTATLSDVKTYLDENYTFSSYDQYMMLKKAYLSYKSADLTSAQQAEAAKELEALQAELAEIIEAVAGGSADKPSTGNITVYFTNNQNWSKVNAHIWGSAGNMTFWPGQAMTYVKTNSMNQDIYSIDINYDNYQYIIFTNGSEQTKNIFLEGKDGVGYYLDAKDNSDQGWWTVKTYPFS
ncbi:MAG: starch-binding protein [Ruminococcus sp.]